MKRPALAVVVFLCLHVELSAQVANGVQGEQAMQTQKVLADHSQIDSTTSHGFIDKGGVFTSLDFPGATETQAAGINAADEVVGLYVDASSVEHGFILNGGVYTQLDPPQSTSTIAFGVNDAGTISGSYTDASNNDHGFLYSGGSSTEWMWPGRRGHN